MKWKSINLSDVKNPSSFPLRNLPPLTVAQPHSPTRHRTYSLPGHIFFSPIQRGRFSSQGTPNLNTSSPYPASLPIHPPPKHPTLTQRQKTHGSLFSCASTSSRSSSPGINVVVGVVGDRSHTEYRGLASVPRVERGVVAFCGRCSAMKARRHLRSSRGILLLPCPRP